MTIAYIVSRFPKLTETFVLYEMLAVERHGATVELFPLQRESTPVTHAEAAAYVARARYAPFLSWKILAAQAHFLRRQPASYLSSLWTLLRANWGSRRYFFGAIAFFPKSVHFARQMADLGVSHIHAHFASHPAAAAYTIHRLTGIPYSFTAHGSDLHRDQHMLCEKVADAAFVVTISNYNKKMIAEICKDAPSGKVIVVHCGVDTSVFADTCARVEKPAGAPFHILCVGTLHEVKGQTHLIEACRLLDERGVPYECHFVGDGPDEKALLRQAQDDGILDKLHFHGRLSQPQVAALMAEADVLTAPSVPSSDGRREGIPVVLMEAMSSGVAVVASDLSGIPELVIHGRTGLLVPPGDAEMLADALECLFYDRPRRRELGRAGREKVVAEFDLNTNAATLVQWFVERQAHR